MMEKILNFDAEAGVSTRMLRFSPGVVTDVVITHDFWEGVYIMDLRLTVIALSQSSLLTSSTVPPPPTPTLLSRMSTRH
jgi:hypothetical protein